MPENKITKVRLSNGQIYSFFDKGALRLNDEGVLVTGDTVVDNIIISGGLKITHIDDVPVDKYDYIVVQDRAGKLDRRPKSTFLNDDLGAGAEVQNKVLEIKL